MWDKLSDTGLKQSLNLLSYNSEIIYTYITTSLKVMKLDLGGKNSQIPNKESRICQLQRLYQHLP